MAEIMRRTIKMGIFFYKAKNSGMNFLAKANLILIKGYYLNY